MQGSKPYLLHLLSWQRGEFFTGREGGVGAGVRSVEASLPFFGPVAADAGEARWVGVVGRRGWGCGGRGGGGEEYITPASIH